MYTHPDLAGNIWVNDKEELYAGTDADGNGYKDDRYGYNFVHNTAAISWTDVSDIGHGTHVSGTIAAMNNGYGVCGIAGGDGTKDSGVKIMICQVFAGENSVSLNGEAQAIKYAADNGAVILQCSWGYNSSEANEVEGYSPGPATERNGRILIRWKRKSWTISSTTPVLRTESSTAVSPSLHRAMNMREAPPYPGAYSKCVTVSAVAADFTPASYTNFGPEVDISAPGGDTEYYNAIGEEDNEFWENNEVSGSILSTMIRNGSPAYGYMDGTSMACPHVSGVAALGLSYAVQQRRHFKASEFVALLKESVKPVDNWYSGGKKKTYYRNHNSPAAAPPSWSCPNTSAKWARAWWTQESC